MRWLFWWRPPCLLRRVLVAFTHDPTEAFEGVLYRYRGGWLTLQNATALKASQRPLEVTGEVVIHRTQIAYLQVLP